MQTDQMNLVAALQMVVSKWIACKQLLDIQDGVDFRLYVV